MTRETAKQLWPIIKAFGDGENVEIKTLIKTPDGWVAIGDNPAFDGPPEIYRIKPKPREYWVNIYPPKHHPVMGAIYASKEEAQKNAMIDSLECIRVVEAP